jgi:hypothetical protein
MDKNADYLSTMQAQLKRWDADVDALAAEAEKAAVDARGAYYEHVSALRAERYAAAGAFEELRLAAAGVVEQKKERMQVAWETMRTALAKVTADLAGK